MNENRKTRLVSDTGCDIPEGWDDIHNIDLLPFGVLIDDREYVDRIELKPEKFYELAKNTPGIPKTNQVMTRQFEEKFLECAENGAEDIIAVVINSAGSKTYDNALQALDNLTQAGKLGGTKVHIIDSHCYSIGYGYPVIEAAKKINAGQSVESVIAYLKDWFSCVETLLLGFDLRHMKKSGRITAAAGFLGEMMGLKPIISMIDEKTTVIKKSRGEKNAVDDAIDAVMPRRIPETPWLLIHSESTGMEEYLISEMNKKTGQSPAMDSVAGAVVASNAGVRFMGIIYRGQPRR